MGHVEDPATASGGSYLVMSDGTATSERVIESDRQYDESGVFDGLEPVEAGGRADADGHAGVARMP